MHNPGRNINSGASDRLLHSDRIFGRNAQMAVIRQQRGERVKSAAGGGFSMARNFSARRGPPSDWTCGLLRESALQSLL
jgi:hypothetical protein